MTTAIEFQHVQKDFNGQTVIPDLNLTIDQGDLFVLVGTSGSGKTTSLKMINCLEPLTAGKILVNGTDTTTIPVRSLRWQMGYVLQQIALFPTMTVAQNIAVIPEMKGTAKKEINRLMSYWRKLASIQRNTVTGCRQNYPVVSSNASVSYGRLRRNQILF